MNREGQDFTESVTMAGFNRVLLLGNLTRDPQLSYTPSQTAVVDFGVATNRKWSAQDGSQRDETCFVDCRAFGRMAENINKFFTKGKPIFLEGRLTYDTWTAQDGTKRSRHRVTVENFQFLPGTGGPGGRDQGGRPADRGAPQGPIDNQMPDDDIPF
jgi:single-strand DNA-binding protein